MKSKIVALSSISAGIIAIILTIGAYFEYADIFCVIISSVFVILPLYYNSYKGSILCYLAGGVIAFLFSGFNISSVVFPLYFLFSGLYPILSFKFRSKHYKIFILYIIGAIWCIASFYGGYFYYTEVMGVIFNDLPEIIEKYLMIIIPIFAIIFYFVYDRFIFLSKRTLDFYLDKIIRKK